MGLTEPTLTQFAASRLITIAEKAYSTAKKEGGKNPHPNEVLISIAFSAAYVEAILNEIVEIYTVFERIEKDKVANMNGLSLIWDMFRRSSTETKFRLMMIALTCSEFNANNPVFRDFKYLFELRNKVIHAEPIKSDAKGNVEPNYCQDLIKHFEKIKIIQPLAKGERITWADRLRTPQVALWAIDTSKSIHTYLIDLLPSCKTKEALKELFAFQEKGLEFK